MDQAVKNFVEAGCLPSDIKSALKNHVKGSDIKAPAVLEEKEVCITDLTWDNEPLLL